MKKKKRKLNKKGKILLFIILVILLFIIISSHRQSKEVIKKEIKQTNDVNDKIIHNEIDSNDLRVGEEIVGKSSKGYLITKLNDVYYVDGLLIVNKTYSLPDNYKPVSPYKEITKDYLYGEDYIEDYVMDAFLKMKEAANKENIKLKITSGYRSYSVQKDLYSQYMKKDGKEEADTYSARAGHSEHQSGLCFDLNGTNKNFIKTKEGKWLNDNCYKYGFVIRFPSGKTNNTGYIYEGWHFRYVGVELATKLYNNGDWISIEEYYGISSEYKD